MNMILTSHSAIVDGKWTALAGCDNTDCKRDCMRKDPRLQYREIIGPADKPCRCFIKPEHNAPFLLSY